MKINIKPPAHAEAKALVQSTEKKMKQFFKDYNMVLEADVRFRHGADQASDKSCEIYLKMQDRNIFVIQKGETFDTSVTKAIEKLGYQIKNK
jgi:ribosome-associated translation inhibitor RaiA